VSTRAHNSRVSTQRSGGHEWETPRALFDEWNREFAFTIDGAALEHNAKLPRYWTPITDGLLSPWQGERVFVNPPFGKEIALWVRKAAREQTRGCPLSVLLVPVRSDTAWWHDFVIPFAEVRFLRGRVRFEIRGGGGAIPLPFRAPSSFSMRARDLPILLDPR
jgi:phage N-6-adenine-methyltransferase